MTRYFRPASCFLLEQGRKESTSGGGRRSVGRGSPRPSPYVRGHPASPVGTRMKGGAGRRVLLRRSTTASPRVLCSSCKQLCSAPPGELPRSGKFFPRRRGECSPAHRGSGTAPPRPAVRGAGAGKRGWPESEPRSVSAPAHYLRVCGRDESPPRAHPLGPGASRRELREVGAGESAGSARHSLPAVRGLSPRRARGP